MRFATVCSGIEAPSVAWHPLGWTPAFFSEIEPFPCSVLAHHYHDVPNLGDMTAIEAAAWRGKVDVLCGGTPCQAFSVAGKRGSLDDARGKLSLVFCELVHGIDPLAVLWENVPGVLSVKDNAFGCFLAGLVGEDSGPILPRGHAWPNAGMVIGPRRSAAWRVLDAQYFGLAQRRRRVFVVSFRTGDGINPGAVLFEPEGVRRHSAPSREAGAGVTQALTRRLGASGPDDNQAQANHLIAAPHAPISPALKARDGKGPSSDGDGDGDGDGAILVPMVAHTLKGEGHDASEDGTGRGVPLVPVGYTIHGTDKTARVASEADVAGSLRTKPPGSQENSSTTVVAYGIASDALDRTGEGAGGTAAERAGLGISEDVSPALKAQHANAVAFQTRIARNGRGQPETICPTLQGADAGETSDMRPCVIAGGVRRLTPVECERLQGFPDNYTNVPHRNKPAADRLRYRALGNSMAVPVVAWIGRRIDKVLSSLPTREAVQA